MKWRWSATFINSIRFSLCMDGFRWISPNVSIFFWQFYCKRQDFQILLAIGNLTTWEPFLLVVFFSSRTPLKKWRKRTGLDKQTLTLARSFLAMRSWCKAPTANREPQVGGSRRPRLVVYGCFPKWWVSPTTMGFPTKNDHFWVEIGDTTI